MSEDGGLEYHQYPITSTNLTNSFEDFKKGRKQLRNLQDDARDLSYGLRDELKGHWKARQGTLPSVRLPEGALDGILEEPCHASDRCSENPTGSITLPPSDTLTTHEHACTAVDLVDVSGADVDGRYEVVNEPTYVPPPLQLEERVHQQEFREHLKTPSLSHSSKSRPPPADTAKNGVKKRKSSSRGDRVKDGLGHKT